MNSYADDMPLMDAYSRLDLLKVAQEIASLREDPHLLLGITKQVALAFVRNSLRFPDSYNRETAFGAKGKEDWITKTYGHKLTGYDLAVSIKQWLSDAGCRHLSIAEVLLKEGDRGVGDAKVFVSHVQSEPFEKTLLLEDSREKYLPLEIPLWIDYFVLRQCQKDFEPKQIYDIIQRIRNTIIVEDVDLSYLTRSFCVLEVASTPEGCLTFPIHDKRKSAGDRSCITKLWISLLPVFLVLLLALPVFFLILLLPACFGCCKPSKIREWIAMFITFIFVLGEQDHWGIDIAGAAATNPEDKLLVDEFLRRLGSLPGWVEWDKTCFLHGQFLVQQRIFCAAKAAGGCTYG